MFRKRMRNTFLISKGNKVFTEVRAARTSEGISQITVATAARRLWCSLRSSDELIFLSLCDFYRSTTLCTVEKNDLAVCQLFCLELRQTASAVLASSLSWFHTRLCNRLACDGSLTISLCQKTFGIDRRSRRRV